MLVGVLAVQGAFVEHIDMLGRLGVTGKEIRKKDDLSVKLDGLIFPGGESSVMGKLLRDLELFTPLQSMIEQGIPVLGTCAGMILLANKLCNDSRVHFGTMNIEVVRNAYGRQLGSFNTKAIFETQIVEMPFIRAPYINSVSNSVEVLSVVDDKIVAAREKNQLVTAFHPELTADSYVHRYFLNMINLVNS